MNIIYKKSYWITPTIRRINFAHYPASLSWIVLTRNRNGNVSEYFWNKARDQSNCRIKKNTRNLCAKCDGKFISAKNVLSVQLLLNFFAGGHPISVIYFFTGNINSFISPIFYIYTSFIVLINLYIYKYLYKITKLHMPKFPLSSFHYRECSVCWRACTRFSFSIYHLLNFSRVSNFTLTHFLRMYTKKTKVFLFILYWCKKNSNLVVGKKSMKTDCKSYYLLRSL